MADRAIRGEACGNVIWYRSAQSRSALPRSQMAPIAGRGRESVIVGHMAGNAGSWCR